MMLKKYGFLLIFAVVALVGFWLYKAISQYLKDRSEFSSLTKMEIAVSKLSKSKAQLAQDAELIYQAVLEGNVEDEDIVVRIMLSLKTTDDYNQLCKSFGIREDNAAFKNFRGTLPQALVEYMSERELATVRKHLTKLNVNL